MVGTTIESRPSRSWGAIAGFAVTVGMLLLALVTREWGFGVAALLPLFIAIALLLAQPPAFAAEFTEEALLITQPRLIEIPYTSLEGLKARRRDPDPALVGPCAYPMLVIHQSGIEEIPARLNVPSDDVYRFLMGKLTRSG